MFIFETIGSNSLTIKEKSLIIYEIFTKNTENSNGLFSARSSWFRGFKNSFAFHFLWLSGETVSKNVFKETWTPGHKVDKDTLWF